MSIPKSTWGGPHEAHVVYLAGPMTGRKDWNRTAFLKARAAWVAANWIVYDPIELDDTAFGGPEAAGAQKPYIDLMLRDLARIRESHAVAVLEDWADSRGARLEVHFAHVMGLPVYEADTGRTLWHSKGLCPIPVHDTTPVHEPVNTESVLQEAERLINGPRQGAYGHPLDDFTKTGRIWGAILGIPDVPAEKVALMMTGVKISREVHQPGHDNRVDGAGYWGCLDKVVEERNRRKNDAADHG